MSKLFVAGPGTDDVAIYRHKLDSLTKQSNDLESELARRSASFRQRQDYENVTSERVAALLPPKAVLLDFLRYKYFQLKPDTTIPHYLVTVLTSEGAKGVVDLGEASAIDSLVTRCRSHLQSFSSEHHLLTVRDLEEYKGIARELYELTVRPVEEYVVDKDLLLISPDGALNLISFAGLLDSDDRYLIEKYQVHYLSAGRDLLRLKDVSKEDPGLFALGDPDYDANLLADTSLETSPMALASSYVGNVRSGCTYFLGESVPRLPGTRLEVEKIARAWEKTTHEPVDAFLGTRASEDNFVSQAPSHRVVHLATHGYYLGPECQPVKQTREFGLHDSYMGENPLLLSGLFLAGANSNRQGADTSSVTDGVLTALEVSGMDFSGTDLVVLSACETGLGTVESGEGVYGLRRAFLLSGARTVMSALWPVSDQATSELMERIYQGKGESLAEIMQQHAVEKISAARKRGAPDHPYYWGAFIATGDWRAH